MKYLLFSGFNHLTLLKLVFSKKTRVQEISNGKSITSKHPRVDNITYDNIKTTSFVKVKTKKLSIEDLSSLIKQNNYTHLHLQILASHLSQMEENFLSR